MQRAIYDHIGLRGDAFMNFNETSYENRKSRKIIHLEKSKK